MGRVDESATGSVNSWARDSHHVVWRRSPLAVRRWHRDQQQRPGIIRRDRARESLPHPPPRMHSGGWGLLAGQFV